MIKRILILMLSLITIVFGQKEFGKITLPLGRVQVQKGGTGAFKKALPRMSINEKDVIKTLAKSRCEISLIGGGSFELVKTLN